MRKRALLIGIDNYDKISDLQGCVNDVKALHPLLARHSDDSVNFSCQVLTSDSTRVDRQTLLVAIDDLFNPMADVAFLYFAGHGVGAAQDVVLVTQDGDRSEYGLSTSQILGKIQASTVPEIIVVLDCCYSGGAGGVPQLGTTTAALRAGVAILSASRADQPAAETVQGRGLFSVHFCGALDGGAADVLGRVTLAGIYAYLDESFDAWGQSPTLKANLERLHELRICDPAVPKHLLRQLPTFFADPDTNFPLDPSYEPDSEPRHPEHESVFAILQSCRAAKLIEPVDADHMYYAAMNSKACRLTALGKHYWWMAKANRL